MKKPEKKRLWLARHNVPGWDAQHYVLYEGEPPELGDEGFWQESPGGTRIVALCEQMIHHLFGQLLAPGVRREVKIRFEFPITRKLAKKVTAKPAKRVKKTVAKKKTAKRKK